MGKRHHNVDMPLRHTESEPQHHKNLFASGMWQKFHRLFGKDDPTQSPIDCSDDDQWPSQWDRPDPSRQDQPRVGLPRQATFRRQNSERRDRLLPVEPGHAERRALSSTRHISTSLPRPRATSSPPYWQPGRSSAPAVNSNNNNNNNLRASLEEIEPRLPGVSLPTDSTIPTLPSDHVWSQDDHLDRPPRPPSTTSSDDSQYVAGMPLVDDKADLRAELDSRWILNLSMHFRDKSDREKFFVTYAETPNRWRRVTVSCDYRNAEPGSLETDLKELQFQRDKSLQIYESIRDSLPEIQFYDTVTNLKLETTDGRLHVHVTEDVNEIIPYPSRSTIAHTLIDPDIRPMEICESDLVFDSHLSGFVYRVMYKDKVYIKKEIPGPDTVDEFLYEINALHDLHDSNHVIHLEAIILDDDRQVVKGLLINYAEKGAVVDLLYDHKGNISWEDRCRWAEDAIRGLSEIHEEGYVQGDFTLSNIVVDGNNRAKIIDINRRGCPVGWEPPEIATKIASNQRISMYIGEKSDLYQLGMTLWALAMDDDEPERHVPPLSVQAFPLDVPEWYQEIVRICLSPRPRHRLSAKELIDLIPEESSSSSEEARPVSNRPRLKLLTPEEYIDPADAVGRDDIERLSFQRSRDLTPYSPRSSRDDYTFTYPKSSNYEIESQSSAYERPRGRRSPTNFGHLGRHERRHWITRDDDSHQLDEVEPNIVAISPGGDRDLYDEIEFNGHPYLVTRGTFNEEEMRILAMVSTVDEEVTHEEPAEQTNSTVVKNVDPAADPTRRPSIQTKDSTNSDSTPRGSLMTLPILDSSTEDTNDSIFTDHQNHLPDRSLQHETESVGIYRVPRLPYDDSGYDEPVFHEDELGHDDAQRVDEQHGTVSIDQDCANTLNESSSEPSAQDEFERDTSLEIPSPSDTTMNVTDETLKVNSHNDQSDTNSPDDAKTASLISSVPAQVNQLESQAASLVTDPEVALPGPKFSIPDTSHGSDGLLTTFPKPEAGLEVDSSLDLHSLSQNGDMKPQAKEISTDFGSAAITPPLSSGHGHTSESEDQCLGVGKATALAQVEHGDRQVT